MGSDGQITRRGSVVGLFLDEMNADVSQLETVSMSDVALIKVFDPPFIGAVGVGQGVRWPYIPGREEINIQARV
jgi:hypothetical protein